MKKKKRKNRATEFGYSHQKISKAECLLDAVDIITSPIFHRCIFLIRWHTSLSNFNFSMIALNEKNEILE